MENAIFEQSLSYRSGPLTPGNQGILYFHYFDCFQFCFLGLVNCTISSLFIHALLKCWISFSPTTFFFFLRFINGKGRVTERRRERDLPATDSFIHYPNTCNSQDWASQELGARTSAWVSHLTSKGQTCGLSSAFLVYQEPGLKPTSPGLWLALAHDMRASQASLFCWGQIILHHKAMYTCHCLFSFVNPWTLSCFPILAIEKSAITVRNVMWPIASSVLSLSNRSWLCFYAVWCMKTDHIYLVTGCIYVNTHLHAIHMNMHDTVSLYLLAQGRKRWGLQ